MIPESCNDLHIFELRIEVQFRTSSISKILLSYYINALDFFLLLNFDIITRVSFGMKFFRDLESRIPVPGIWDRNF